MAICRLSIPARVVDIRRSQNSGPRRRPLAHNSEVKDVQVRGVSPDNVRRGGVDAGLQHVGGMIMPIRECQEADAGSACKQAPIRFLCEGISHDRQRQSPEIPSPGDVAGPARQIRLSAHLARPAHSNAVRMDRAFSPQGFVRFVPGALPQAGMNRAFGPPGTRYRSRPKVGTRAPKAGTRVPMVATKAPKARTITAWGNAPGTSRIQKATKGCRPVPSSQIWRLQLQDPRKFDSSSESSRFRF